MNGLTYGTTLGDVLLKAADERPEGDAVIFPEQRFTYSAVRERAIEVARSLVGLGVKKGDHVGLLMPNCPDFIFALFGCTLIGAVAVPLNTRYRRRELGYVVENGDLVAILTSDIIDEHVDFAALLEESIPGIAEADASQPLSVDAAPRLRHVVLFGTRQAAGMIGRKAFDAFAEGVSADEVLRRSRTVRIRDVLAMLYTSGTTANPKGCLLTHEAIVRDWIVAADRIGFTSEDGFWSPCPMFHMAGTGPMISAFSRAGRFLTMTYFDATAALDLIEEEQVTHLYTAFPTIAMGLLRHPDYDAERVRSARWIMNVAPPETLRLMQSLIPNATQVSAYGLTEATGTVCLGRPEDSAEQRTVSGPPLEGVELRTIDPESGVDCGPGVPGEILIRGFNCFEGYYRDPEKTADTVDAEGWVRTGDLGSLDEDGRLTYVGRVKDMLKVGGENVAPSEIEAHLGTHPSVILAQVVGRPDDRYGEIPVAFVELAAGADVPQEELIDFCRGEIASFKVPREVRFVTEWPMSATKIQKFRLREMMD